MTRGEEHLHNAFVFCFFEYLLMIVSVSIHFVSCVNQFPISISRNLMFPVSLGLRKIQLFDLAYKLTN